MKLIRLGIIVALISTFAITIVMFPVMPDVVVSHWNAAGQANGHMSKVWGLFLIPLIMVGCVALFGILPRIDPLGKNYEQFRDYYEGFILVFVTFMFAIQAQIMLWGIGIQISPNHTFPVLLGILFIYLGFLIEHTEPNWFVGIRTPWTLSSTTVWNKTRERGGKLFKLAGIVSVVGIVFQTYAIWFILIPVFAVAIYTVVYSYFLYKNEQTTVIKPV